MATYPQADDDLVTSIEADDMPNGGHRTLFFPLLQAARTFARFVRDTAAELTTLASQVAANAASAAAGSGTEASVADIRGGAAAQYLSIRRLYEAMTPVAIPYASSVTLNLDAGINFDIGTLTGNLTLATPSNLDVGKSGYITLVQDATGGRTVSFSAAWKFAGDGALVDTAPNGKSLIAYVVRPGNVLWCTMAAGFA